ncbi:MAG TPA: hypothetical protein VJY65_12695 [Chloroflexota bacterium]|nr:hypothetical protein [Chloroflexota bacterium]
MTDDVIAHGGKVIPGAQLDAMFERAEAGDVLAGHPGRTRAGRPLSVGEDAAEPASLRAEAEALAANPVDRAAAKALAEELGDLSAW